MATKRAILPVLCRDPKQATLAAGHFWVAAWDEWQQIEDASGSKAWGTA